MTVCVAAICQYIDNPTIIAGTDKMVTAGSITFEGGIGKRYFLTSLLPPSPIVVALGAGNSSDELQICQLAERKIRDSGIDTVAQAAECFAEAYREYRRTTFEHELLAPSGLTFEEFNRRQQELAPDFVSSITRSLASGYLPISERRFGCSTIIAGVDTASTSVPGYIQAHLYVVRDPGLVSCEDKTGFVAVGSGAEQAESYLMLDGYAPNRVFNHCVLDVYSAKRAAENALGVGLQTELLRIDNSGVGDASVDNLEGIEKIYQKRIGKIQQIDGEAKEEISAYMESLNVQATPTPAQAQVTREEGNGVDQEDVRPGSQVAESPS